MNDDEDAVWTLDDLFGDPTELRERPLPSPEQVKELVSELHAEWVDASMEYTDMISWTFARYGLDPRGGFTYTDVSDQRNRRKYQYSSSAHMSRAQHVRRRRRVGGHDDGHQARPC